MSLLSLVLIDKWWLSAPCLALAVHLKTYPAPWALTIWMNYAFREKKFLFGFIPWSAKGIKYGLLSFCVFVSFSLGCFRLYEHEFLEHAHLHHVSRQDTRHNFSVSFLYSPLFYLKLITEKIVLPKFYRGGYKRSGLLKP